MLMRYRDAGIAHTFDNETLGELSPDQLTITLKKLESFDVRNENTEARKFHNQILDSVRNIFIRQKTHNPVYMNIPELNAYIAKHNALASNSKTGEEVEIHRQFVANAEQTLYVLRAQEASGDAPVIKASKKTAEETARQKAQEEQKEIDDAMRQFAQIEQASNQAKSHYHQELVGKIKDLRYEANQLISVVDKTEQQKKTDQLTQLVAAADSMVTQIMATNNLALSVEELDAIIYGDLQAFINNLKSTVPVVAIHTSGSFSEEKVSDAHADFSAQYNREAQIAADAEGKAAKEHAVASMASKWKAGLFSSSFPENRLAQTRNWSITPAVGKKTDSVTIIKDVATGKTLNAAQTRSTEIELSTDFHIKRKSF